MFSTIEIYLYIYIYIDSTVSYLGCFIEKMCNFAAELSRYILHEPPK